MEIKFSQQLKKDDPAERLVILKRTDEDGVFDFEGVPESMNMNIYVEKLHFCWVRQMLTVTLDKQKPNAVIEFVQRGYEFTYRAHQ